MSPPLTKTQEHYLYDLYYNQNFKFGRDRIFEKCKEDETRISERQVMNWLKKQHIYQLYKPTNKTKHIRTTILKEPNKQIGIDLIDMTKYEYKGFNYIFSAIDLFSKKCYIYPLKNKNDAYLGLINLIDDVNDKISSIRSDNGSEFNNEDFNEVLDENNIKHIFSLPYKPQSNGNIERFNGTLKRQIKMYLKSENTYNWIDILPNMEENYNNSVNNTTKKKPNDIDEENYGEINENIKKSVLKERNSDKQFFNIGDNVRIKLEKPDDYGKLWSEELYTIIKVNKPKSRVSKMFYEVRGLRKNFYNDDLQLINEIENEKEEEENFTVSKILKPVIKNNKPYFLIKWKGYSSKHNSYEPRDKLIEDIPKLIKRYEKKYKVIWEKNKVSYTP